MAHTPGPWRFEQDEGEPYWAVGMPYKDGSGRYGSGNAMVYTTAEDARLIAAAPELYAACLALRASLADWIDIQDRDDERNEDDKALAFADAAIAKAEGRTDDQNDTPTDG